MRYKPLKTQKDHEEATKSIEGFKAIAKEISPQAKEITAEELKTTIDEAESKYFSDYARPIRAEHVANAILSKYRVVER